MSQVLTLTQAEIFDQVRLSCQMPGTIERILTHKIIKEAAIDAGITVESSELQQAADSWRLMNQLTSVDDTWLWLQKHHLALEEFEELISATVVSSKLAQHLFGNQVEPYFLEHQLNYAQVAMYEIVLDDLDLARELSYALSEGEISFFEAAYQYISDTELRRKGGYKGLVERKDLKPKISAAVFAATPPQILKPIVTSEGVHLIRVEEIIQPQFDAMLGQQILADLFGSWLSQQVKGFKVEINSDFESNDSQSGEVSSQQLASV